MTPASLTRRATDGFCTTFSTGTVQTMPGTFHSTSRFATPPRSRSAGRNTRRSPCLSTMRRATRHVDMRNGQHRSSAPRRHPRSRIGAGRSLLRTQSCVRVTSSAPTARYACARLSLSVCRRRISRAATPMRAARGRAYGRRGRGPAVPACRRRRSAPRRRRWLGTNTVAPRVRARSPRGCRHSGSGNCACARGRRR